MIDLKTKVKGNILNLSSCNILVEDIDAITKFLGENPHITNLDLCDNEIGSEGVEILVESPNLINLTNLNLGSNAIDSGGVEALAKSPNLINLTNLNLGSNAIDSGGVEALAKSPNLRNLTNLDLDDNYTELQGTKALAESTNLTNLTNLNLGHNYIDSQGVRALAESTTLSKLINLKLDGNGDIGTEGAKALARSEHLTNLTMLSLREAAIGTEGVMVLARSKNLTNLTDLDLANNEIGSEGAKYLASSSYLTNLTKLHLRDNKIDSAGVRTLAESETLGKLTNLDLADNNIGFEGVKALAKFRNLTNLNLKSTKIGSEGVKDLGGSPNLKTLTNLDLTDNAIGFEGVKYLVGSSYLTNLTNLHLRYNDIDTKRVRVLVESATLSKLTNLDLSENNIGFEGAKALAESENLKNLTMLNLKETAIDNKGVKAVAVSTQLTNLTTLDLAENGIDTEGTEYIAKSGNFTKLTTLNLGGNIIDWLGVQALVKSPNLRNLTMLDLTANNIDAEGAVNLAKLANNLDHQIVIEEINELIITSLSPAYRENNANGVIHPEIVKDLIFKLPPEDNGEAYVRYFLEHSKEFPFPINSVDQEGNTLLHYYNNATDMQKFLYERGALPEQEQGLGRLAANKQGVHDKEITKQNHFIVSKMMEAYDQGDKVGLLTSADLCRQDIKGLQFNDLEIKLLGLSDPSKRDTLGKVLQKSQPLPGDTEFVKMVTEKSAKVLKEKYLDNSSGYYNHENAYNEQGDKITIPETIGLVYRLVTEHPFSIEEKRELLVTLIAQNPELVKNKLGIIREKLSQDVTIEQLSERAECHKLLEKTSPEIIKELFSKVSGGLDLDETLKKQKSLKLAESLYWAATTYGPDSNACIGGTWTQAVNSAGIICPELLSQYADHKKKKLAAERLKSGITAENIQEFIPIISKELVTVARDNPSFKEALADFALIPAINFDKPEEITLEQQQIIGKIYQIVSKGITDHLPNYNRPVPKFEEYKIIVEELAKDSALAKFAREYNQEHPQELSAEGQKLAAGMHAERFIQQKKMAKQQFKTAAYDIEDKIAEKEQKSWVEKLAAKSTSNQQESGSRKRTRSTSVSSSPAKRMRTNSDDSFSR